MRTPASRQRGFTYIGLLFAVVIMGLMLTVVGRVWRSTVQHDREAQLLWVGHAYRMAISSYFAAGHRYPAKLEDLLTDDRFPVPKRHLRKLYPDPMTGKADWTLLLSPDQSGIQGVASRSQDAPVKRDGFERVDAPFKDSDCYCQWKFVYVPYRWGQPTALPGTTIGAPPPGQGGGPTPTPGPTAPPGVQLPTTAPGFGPGPGPK
jgi:type II secretory pathway pseudopilin PulG